MTLPVVDRGQNRRQGPYDEGQRHERLGDRDEQGRIPQGEGWAAQSDQETETEGDGRDAQREREFPSMPRWTTCSPRDLTRRVTSSATLSPKTIDIQVASVAIRSEFTNAAQHCSGFEQQGLAKAR